MISYSAYEDDQLLACMRQNDDRAFTALYQRYGAVLMNYALTITGNTADAADILTGEGIYFPCRCYRARYTDPRPGYVCLT